MVLTTENKCKDKKGCCQTVVNVIAENAYDLWKREGNTGTLEDFLQSLKGEKGDKGDPGERGEKGEPGPRLNITRVVERYDDLEELGKTAPVGTIVMLGDASDGRFGQVYIWTGEDFRLLTNLTQVDGVEGKSAYQTWLDLGNTGSEQDFIDSLKGPEDFGTIERKTIEIDEDKVTLSSSLPKSRMLTYNKKLSIGFLRLDFIPKVDSDNWVMISDISKEIFYPRNPQEKVVNGVDGEGTGSILIGSVNKGPMGIHIKGLKKGVRYQVDFDGFF